MCRTELYRTSYDLAKSHSESVALVASLIADEVPVWLISNVLQVRQRGEAKAGAMTLMSSCYRKCYKIKYQASSIYSGLLGAITIDSPILRFDEGLTFMVQV